MKQMLTGAPSEVCEHCIFRSQKGKTVYNHCYRRNIKLKVLLSHAKSLKLLLTEITED